MKFQKKCSNKTRKENLFLIVFIPVPEFIARQECVLRNEQLTGFYVLCQACRTVVNFNSNNNNNRNNRFGDVKIYF